MLEYKLAGAEELNSLLMSHSNYNWHLRLDYTGKTQTSVYISNVCWTTCLLAKPLVPRCQDNREIWQLTERLNRNFPWDWYNRTGLLRPPKCCLNKGVVEVSCICILIIIVAVTSATDKGYTSFAIFNRRYNFLWPLKSDFPLVHRSSSENGSTLKRKALLFCLRRYLILSMLALSVHTALSFGSP